MRLFCSTNYCTSLVAQLGHARRAIATLTAERDTARAECAALRAQQGGAGLSAARRCDGAAAPRK